MLALAAERADGAQTYCVPVAHTVRARDALGPAPVLVVEQAVAIGAGAERLAAEYVRGCLAHENYVRSLRRLGWGEDELEAPTRRLVDALVCVGPEPVAGRIDEHLDAGAHQVALQVLDERALDGAAGERLGSLWSELVSLLAPASVR